MPSFTRLAALAAPIALLGLAACAPQPFRANVARFQQLPVPEGQTFAIQAANTRNQGGLEFQQYANLVSQRLAAQGYRPASAANAQLIVMLDYGVDNGREKIVSRPAPFSASAGFGYGGFYRGRWGRRPFYYGWNDPFFFGGWNNGTEIDSYTYYTSYLDMTISRASNGERLFEGKARAQSYTDSLPQLVPNLVEAMFTNFPGNSGEEVRISIPREPRRR